MRRLATPLIALALVALATPARAGFVPVLVSPTGATTSNTFVYNLNFTTSATLPETLQAGDFLTLYDFDAGVTSPAQVVVAPGGLFTVTVQQFGITPAGGLVNPTDTAINNITFTYTGPTLTVDTTFVATIATAGGPYPGTRTGQYTSIDTLSLGDNQQIGAVRMPTSTAIPEPTSMALLGIGAVGLLAVYRKRLRA